MVTPLPTPRGPRGKGRPTGVFTSIFAKKRTYNKISKKNWLVLTLFFKSAKIKKALSKKKEKGRYTPASS